MLPLGSSTWYILPIPILMYPFSLKDWRIVVYWYQYSSAIINHTRLVSGLCPLNKDDCDGEHMPSDSKHSSSPACLKCVIPLWQLLSSSEEKKECLGIYHKPIYHRPIYHRPFADLGYWVNEGPGWYILLMPIYRCINSI